MSEVCVRVAVRVRPLLPREVLHHHRVCVRVVPGSAQLMLGSDRLFSFDHAFGPAASQDDVYESCVQHLVKAAVDGYNATVFCYGQTGSGKTYTLGGRNPDEEGGLIDRIARDLFVLVEDKTKSDDAEKVTVHVSYMELYKDELRDLLELPTIHKELFIREDERGNTVVAGAMEVVVTSAEELFSVLEMGNAVRHTAATGMNEHSSRSHAILTLQVTVSRPTSSSALTSFRTSKLCLVDLAGSERAKKTGITGMRLKESAHINKDLLALGNVIRALSDQSRNRRGNSAVGPYIPYRDSKLTRFLRDSLGGTAHTLMVACVNPSNRFVAETLSVLQFASKARNIQNCPGQTEIKSHSTTWHPHEARLGELEYELQTLRELLKEKQRKVELEKEKNAENGESFKQSSLLDVSEPDKVMIQEELSQYRLLAHEGALLLAEICGSSTSQSVRQRVQNWQERLTAVSHSHETVKGCLERSGAQYDYLTIIKRKEELSKYQEALHREKQLSEQKDAELRQALRQVEELVQERKAYLKASEEYRKQIRLQTEQLVTQQILIGCLRSGRMTFDGKSSGTTVAADAFGYSENRPNSVPDTTDCIHRPPRKIHSSPPAYSLERVMAGFKMRGHLLLAEVEEKEEVFCPFIRQQAESKDGIPEIEEDEEENDVRMSATGFRHSLNRTWTSQQTRSAHNVEITEEDQACDGNRVIHQPPQASGIKDNQASQNQTKKARAQASAIRRRIQDLSVNMRMKDELIKELDKTDKQTEAVYRKESLFSDDREAGLLARLSMKSQQIRKEMYHSLQHMMLQKAQLQTSLGQQRQMSDDDKDLYSNGLPERSWLEEEEEEILQKRIELQQLEEELRKREEVLQRREACLQQKSKLEMKMLRSSQALTQDFSRVSMQLESLEQQLQRGREGVTVQELEKERDLLKKQRDKLDDQLRDNRVLSTEEEYCLHQLEEAIEALDTAVEFKNNSIREKERKLLVTESESHQSQSVEPAQLSVVIRKLRELSQPEALELLIKYFNKVVCLRETECHLRLRCEELELHAREQEEVLREMETTMRRLTLDTDRRFTQQHRDHLNTVQLLLQKLTEGVSEEAQQAMQDRLQQLEKELFFYKSSSRQLKKKLREIVSDASHSDSQSAQTLERRQMQSKRGSTNVPKSPTDEALAKTHVATTHTKVQAEQTDYDTHKSKHAQHTQPLFLSAAFGRTRVSEGSQIESESPGRSVGGRQGESVAMTPVRLSRRELRLISAPELQLTSSGTRRPQSIVDSSTETIVEDSIEVPRNI
ncbi:kinesin-like protein KIF27 [Salarias fasciatus]|uniref:kinesin-like protein KIF27 n=1 Tax=Salarias fasciatus TaxID=181472 RepID=UPI001176F67C|nr:kinesin-like protein KIF27 [Salarias fasciatus]